MKTTQGIITSLANEKTARVLVTRRWKHPVYKKYVKRTKNYACHVENIKLKLGDRVVIEECKPVSKTKKFKVVSKIGKK